MYTQAIEDWIARSNQREEAIEANAAAEVAKLAGRIKQLGKEERDEAESQAPEKECYAYELYEGRWCIFAFAPDAGGTWPLWLIVALAAALIVTFIVRRARAEERERAEMLAHLSSRLRNAEKREDEAAKRMAAALARAYGDARRDARRDWVAGVAARHEDIVRRAKARIGEPQQ